jgi:hypothetical protein
MRTFLVDQPRTGALRALNYAPAVERIRRAGSSSARPLHDIVKEFGPAYGTVFTRLDCHPDHGVELLSQSDMFAAEPRGRVIRRDSMREPERHLVQRGQILIAGAGTLGENELYGRSLLADGRLAGKYVGPDSMTLVLEEPNDDFSLFAYAWLASPTGVQAIRSTSYGTKLLRFRTELLRSLPVPLAPKAVVAQIASLVRKCAEQLESWLCELSAAREAINSLPEMMALNTAAPPKSTRSLVWAGALPSLCAWNYFAGPSNALARLRAVWTSTVADYLERSDPVNHGGRLTRIPCSAPHGVDFLSQRDVFMAKPIPQRIVAPRNAEWVFARPGQLLMAADGQVTSGSLFGRVELADGGFVGSAITEHIMRLNPRNGLGEALAAFLSTETGQALARSTATGTSVPKARIDLLLSLPAPPPDHEALHDARRAMRRAVSRRLAANAAEAEAIRIIEKEVVPQWLA